MQISTSLFYDRAANQMGMLNARADTLTTQISTGVRVGKPSDDPGASYQLALLGRATADDVANDANVDLAKGLLAQTDTALTSVETQLQRASELAVQASSGVLSASQRTSIAAEIDGIIADVLALANGTDQRGQPLFGGTDGAVPFTRTADGSITLTGSASVAAIPMGDGTSVQATETGARVFGGSGQAGSIDVFATLGALSAALKAGQAPASGTSSALDAAREQVTTARASVGARMVRVDLVADRIDTVAIDREVRRSAIEDTDVTATITELQKTLTILQATQASFTKLSGLSLFDYLR